MADPTPAPTTTPDSTPANAAPATTTPPPAAVGVALLYPDTPAAPEGGDGTPTPPAEALEASPSPEAPAEGEDAPEANPAEEPSSPAEEAAPAEGAPLTAASYTVTLPEGLEVDPTLLATAKETFAKVGLDPKGAQPLMELYAKALEGQQAANQAAWDAQDSSWKTELYALPEFKGATRRTSETTISRLMDEYGGDELRATLINAGLGNNPTLMKALLAMGNLLTEGASAPQGTPANPGPNGGRPTRGQTPGQILYGDSPPSNQ